MEYFIAWIFKKEIIHIDTDPLWSKVYDPNNINQPYIKTCRDCGDEIVLTKDEFYLLFTDTPICGNCNGLNITVETINYEQGDYTHLCHFYRPNAPLLMTNLRRYNDYYNPTKYSWEFIDFQTIPDNELLTEWNIVDFK